MCKPLRGKIDKSWIDEEKYKELFWKKDVQSAVEFYKKYRYYPSKLKYDCRDAWNKIPKDISIRVDVHSRESATYDSSTINNYNIWLFDYSFKDVIV